ncbi:TetR family transcriptional regulator [Herbihabitans rhizosphaerae]|uniref:TetR family transcriptional regulator n=1 Tax=Herbihabitans rhizosphaerae TaxID=1872711 RepID=A0A4Q7L4V3_9PSEU|nr:TetR/AcrR family transcriptional regulator [Herbihabitans rhizosphaerae]RZS44668.1 TetR family transcriptional regulator [Herbihabitans rhizosphaerae]
MSSPEVGKAARTSASILDVATEVLLANPSASMSDVATAAGVGRTTLTNRFPTRQEMLVAVAHDAVDRVEKAVAEAELDVPGEQVVDALRRLVTAAIPLGSRIEFLVRQPSLDLDAELMARLEALDEETDELIRRGQQAGIFRADTRVWWFTLTFNGLIYSAWEAIVKGRLAPLDAPDLVVTTLLRGLGAEQD